MQSSILKAVSCGSSTSSVPRLVTCPSRSMWRRGLANSFLWCLCALSTTLSSYAATITLAWDASTSAGVVSYSLYQSVGTGSFTLLLNTTTLAATFNYDATVTNRWYATAKDFNGLESVPSNIVEKDPTAPPPLGLTFEAESGVITAPFYVTNGVVRQDVQTVGATLGGKAAYAFSVTNSGAYTLSALVNAPSEGANSIYVQIDANPTDLQWWDIPVTAGFEMRTMAWKGETNAHSFSLTVGQHTLIIRGREAMTQLDRIALTPVVIAPIQPQPPRNLRLF